MKQSTLTAQEPASIPFEEHLRTAAGAVRGSLLELMNAVGADPHRPQEVARQLGLRSGLTWKVCKIVQEVNVHNAVTHIPGPAGLRLFLDAIEKAGAPAETVRTARDAARAFEQMVKTHTGDRATLEIMINDMLSAPAQTEQSEQSRKNAFQGNSGTWGVRARVQLSLNILAPNRDDPQQCDLAQIGGLIGFRRLRRDARWLLFRRERWTDEAVQEEQDTSEPLDQSSPTDLGVPLIGDFCSKPLPEINVKRGAGEDQYELPAGPVGNTAALSLVYGSVMRAVGPAYGDKPGEFSELGTNLLTPAEHLLLDVLVHRDFQWAMQPEFVVYSRMDGGAMPSASRHLRNILPVPETAHDLGFGTAALGTPLMPEYTRLQEYVFGRLGWNPDDFRAFRVTMPFPPIPTATMLRSELPVR